MKHDFHKQSLDCVHCGLCLQVCPTYRVLGLETDSPRGRIYLMRALAEDRLQDPQSVRIHLDQCLDCRACETACPSGVRYGSMLENVRSRMEQQQPKRGFVALLTRFLLEHVVAHQGRLRLAFRLARVAEVLGMRRLAAAVGLMPRHMAQVAPPVPPDAEREPIRTGLHRPAGVPRGRVALFTGCVMEQLFGRINRATLDLLLANGFEVDVPAAQGCCGALLIHNGQAEAAKRLARNNVAAFRDATHVVNNSAGCGCALKEYGELLDGDREAEAFGAKCRDISEFLAGVGLTAQPAPCTKRVAYDDPCHLCHGQGVREQPRSLLAQVPGLQLVPHARPEDCCGSAGIYNLLQPALAAQIGDTKVAALREAGVDAVVTGNPGCMMQIRGRMRAAGMQQEVVHPVELLLPRRDAT